MTVSNTLRFLLKKYSSGGDPHPSRVEFNLMIDAIEGNAAMFSQGPTGSRPAAGKRGRWYWDETAERMYYDNGSAWKDQNPNGGGGAGAPIVPGTPAAEGISAKSARADHTHALPLATTAAAGAMSPAQKATLDAATATATDDTLMKRGVGGRTSVGTPTDAGHATTKAYVDGVVNTVGEDAADYADAAVAAIPLVTSTTDGRMRKADKAKLDTASSSATPNTLMMTDGSGRYKAAAPSASTDVTNKTYVDTAVNGAKDYADTTATTAAAAAVTADRPVFTAFTPVWSGFENLGTTGLIQSGQYAKIGPNLVRADLRLRAGTGGALGTGRISVTLPFPAGGAIMQFGSGALLPTGLDGVVRKVEVGARPGNTTAELWAPATPAEVLKTPGEAGYPFAKNGEIHVSITYQTAA